jgi:hypothetical protein
MVEQFLTQAEDQQFKNWLVGHSNGFYLNERDQGNIRHGRGEMVLHRVGCHHLGNGEGVCSTTYAKAASDSREDLVAWASNNGLTVAPCSSCRP